ncbi:hypothetical protein C8R44DRAFT_747474 [Mycena epipterygia]|nr:hypothetical protein C8R44DRAFT_747474 [Mycena epipterygia]
MGGLRRCGRGQPPWTALPLEPYSPRCHSTRFRAVELSAFVNGIFDIHRTRRTQEGTNPVMPPASFALRCSQRGSIALRQMWTYLRFKDGSHRKQVFFESSHPRKALPVIWARYGPGGLECGDIMDLPSVKLFGDVLLATPDFLALGGDDHTYREVAAGVRQECRRRLNIEQLTSETRSAARPRTWRYEGAGEGEDVPGIREDGGKS